jgi:hypothetical protein
MGDEAERRRRGAASSIRPREPTGRLRDPSGAFDTRGRSSGTTRVVSVRLKDTVTDRDVYQSIQRAEETLDRIGRARLMIDCRRVEGYEGDARDRLTKWARTQRDRVDRVAVVTDNVLWQMVLRTSSLASQQAMRGFTDIEDAFDWLSG